MIIDSPVIANLALGADRVIPTEGDAQLIVLSTLSPVIEPIQIHNVATLSTDLANTSRLIEYSANRINQAALTDPFLFLPRGLYSIEMNCSARSNFVPGALTDFLGFQLVYQTFTVSLASLMLNIGTGQLNIRSTLLLASQATLQFLIPATNAVATNTIQVRAGINVIRRI